MNIDNFKSIKLKIKNCIFRKSLNLYNFLINNSGIKKYIQKDLDIHFKAYNFHQKNFSHYKNLYLNNDIIIVGTGPSLNNLNFNKFKNEINNPIYIALNRAYAYSLINFDFIFSIDFNTIRMCIDEIINYDAIKFFGDIGNIEDSTIPERYFMLNNVFKYIPQVKPYRDYPLTVDIDIMPLSRFTSVSFDALQFALFTHPKRIFLVGIDCTSIHFDRLCDEEFPQKDEYITNALFTWKNVKNFIRLHYPDIEIISVNPVKLEGVYKDLKCV